VLDDGTGNCEGAATLFLEDIDGYLQIFMQLSMAIIRNDPTDGRFEFLAHLVHIAGEMLAGEPMFDFVWRTVSEVVQLDNPISCQWGTFLLTTIVESQPESFGKRIREIAHFLLGAGAAPNEGTMKHAGRLISALAEYCRDAVSVVADEFCTFLLDLISDGANVPDLFISLEQLLEAVDTPPSGFATIKDTLLQLIGRVEQPQTFMASLAHLLEKLPQPQEAISTDIAPLVTKLHEYGLRLLSSIVVAAPGAVKGGLSLFSPSLRIHSPSRTGASGPKQHAVSGSSRDIMHSHGFQMPPM
jgi:hypothetical protein